MSNAFFSEFQPGLDMATVSFENPVLFEALVFILDFIYTVMPSLALARSACTYSAAESPVLPAVSTPVFLCAHVSALNSLQGKCMLPRTGELPEQVMDLSATWGLTAIKDQLEAHGFLSLTPKSCATCLVHVYNKGSHDDWETRARRELDLVLRNFETIKEKDLLLLPEPVMAAILASSGLAVTSEKQVLDRLKFWMKHELVPSQDLARDKPGSVEGKRADEVQSMTIEARKTLRGMELLKHIRWPEFQREGLSEMFMSPDPEIAHFITPLVIESLAWANFSTEARRQRIANADVSQHPKHLPMHVMVPRDAPLPMTPLHGYVEGLDVRDKGQKVHAVGGTGGVAVFGHSTNSTTHHYILEWRGAQTDHPDDCYVGIMCATSLSLEKSGCFVLCETGKDEPENYSPGQPVQLTVNAANKELELWAIDEDNRPHKCLNTKQCQSIATPWIPCVALFHQGSSFTWRLADPV